MQRNTIKWKIFKYNLLLMILLVALTTIIFNIAVRKYMEKEVLGQLSKIASRTEDTALRQGPDFFPEPGEMPPPPPPLAQTDQKDKDLFRFYFMLDRSLREPLSVLNADYILLDSDKNRITPFPEDFFTPSDEVLQQITDELKAKSLKDESYLNFHLANTEYIAIVKPVSQKNSFGLGWIIIYSSLQKVNQLQLTINMILFTILIFSAFIILLFSSLVSKKIYGVILSLSQPIRAMAERNFGQKIPMPVEDELQDLVSNINIMSEKLAIYDNAQRTFLENASHEFRTPLMAIQSYAEGVKYDVVDSGTAVDIIIDEAKRMTYLVEDLLYLSRLDTIEEEDYFKNLNLNELMEGCIERMNGIAGKNNKQIIIHPFHESIEILGDEEKLSRAITNVISNCIRHANRTVRVVLERMENNKVKITIFDDGPGFDPDELPYIFERFYKGKKGNYGLGLAISRNVIEKHHGKITAENSETGASFIIELPVTQVY
ncbi:sensor histidine kinase [Desulforamulus ruminis]|uniref:sensor histidine kinase n=1 Tax=Desulforamulus ruminis TaxID=1564 RepID=UPI002355747A|nr:HAMP domain-containing sensor histidine kinase [Desulforamulus ruminis]